MVTRPNCNGYHTLRQAETGETAVVDRRLDNPLDYGSYRGFAGLVVRLDTSSAHIYTSSMSLATKPEWRNWQTRRIQDPVRFTPRVGSSPTSGKPLRLGMRVPALH